MSGTANGQKLDQTDLFGAGSTVAQTLAGTLTLTDADQSGQFLNCDGADRIVVLPAEATSNHYFAIVNTTAATYTLTVKDDAANVIVTLTVGTGALLLSDGTSWKVINPIAAVTYSENLLTGDVTLTTDGTWYDGPSLSLAAGTWVLIGQVAVIAGGNAATYGAKLWDGSTVESSANIWGADTARYYVIPLSGVIVLGTTTTIKISVTKTSATGCTMKANTGEGNSASRLTALKIA